MTDFGSNPHRRFNPLTGQWVVVSPHRGKRPWQGAQEALASDERPAHDPSCYLCAGNERITGDTNPQYTETYVFPNDFPALLKDGGAGEPDANSDPCFRTQAIEGECRVVCFSPNHGETLAEMAPPAIETVIDTWVGQVKELSAKYPWVQVFENKGAAMGCSNPHPHGQIWASSFIPNEVARKEQRLREHTESTNSNLLVEYARKESADGARTIVENDHWIAVVPFGQRGRSKPCYYPRLISLV